MAALPDQYQNLFDQLIAGTLSPADTEKLIAWLGSDEPDPATAELIWNHLGKAVQDEQINPDLVARLEARLPAILQQPGRIRRLPLHQRQWVKYAAVLLFLAATGVFFWSRNRPEPQPIAVRPAPPANDITPGKQGATLTLADGRTVVLDSLGNGLVTAQSGSNVLLHNGQLSYSKNNSGAGETAYNTIATPKGRQFQLVLSDGTKVWLNAASSLHYPTVFTGKTRQVQITGEAYFEVAKNVTMPFQVQINDQTKIEVLGTHFNINSYSDEQTINTTLLEGSVRVFHKGKEALLKPGQQAQVTGSQDAAPIKVVAGVNLERVVAWKNGVFDFQDAQLDEVMRQLSRWYDVDVVYEKGIPDLEFIGKMGKDLPLSSVLRGLELSKVKFRVEGRKLIVLP